MYILIRCCVKMSYLTTVTLEVEVLVESHHSDCLLAARGWNNGFITAHTQRGETPGIKRWLLLNGLQSNSHTFSPNQPRQIGPVNYW